MMPVVLAPQLELDRCPHCKIDNPNLFQVWNTATQNHAGKNGRFWRVYQCKRCGGLVIASSDGENAYVKEVYPEAKQIDEDLPEKAKHFLDQAINSVQVAPAGAVILAASAVDAMLQKKGYTEGKLYYRIIQAAADHLITSEMSKWAHEVRLDANDQRHADENASLPNSMDAQRSIDFVMALGVFLFVMPAKVQRGIEAAKPPTSTLASDSPTPTPK